MDLVGYEHDDIEISASRQTWTDGGPRRTGEWIIISIEHRDPSLGPMAISTSPHLFIVINNRVLAGACFVVFVCCFAQHLRIQSRREPKLQSANGRRPWMNHLQPSVRGYGGPWCRLREARGAWGVAPGLDSCESRGSLRTIAVMRSIRV